MFVCFKILHMKAKETLEQANRKTDYVITHCAPTSVVRQLNRDYQPDTLTDFLEIVERRLEFGHWLFGHYHRNQAVNEKHTLLWEDIVRLT